MIEEIFDELRTLGAVHSSDEFSRYWLGKERSYLRCLRAKHRPPSLKALATCAVRLLKTADRFGHSNRPIVSARGKQMRNLANRCLEQILVEGTKY